jgi:hypothetical protein
MGMGSSRLPHLLMQPLKSTLGFVATQRHNIIIIDQRLFFIYVRSPLRLFQLQRKSASDYDRILPTLKSTVTTTAILEAV